MKSILLLAGLTAGIPAARSAVLPYTSPGLSPADKEFANKAAMANSYELKSAELAKTMSTSAEDKAYADQIIKDHTKVGNQLKEAVSKADSSVQLPMDPDSKGQKRLEGLQNAGKGFDAEYRKQMIESHQEIHKFFGEYIEREEANPGIKEVISGAQPTVEMHLAAAKKLPS